MSNSLQKGIVFITWENPKYQLTKIIEGPNRELVNVSGTNMRFLPFIDDSSSLPDQKRWHVVFAALHLQHIKQVKDNLQSSFVDKPITSDPLYCFDNQIK